VAFPGVMAREGVWAREGVLRAGTGIGWVKWDEDCVVEFDEVTGDQGRDDAIETLEKLLLEGVPMVGTGGISSWWWLKYPVDDGGLLGVVLVVALRSSCSTFVELFQRCL